MSSLPAFGPAFRKELATLIRWRRDVRRFRADPIEEGVIADLLELAAMAPSVGNSQPWRFVLVESASARAAVKENFRSCNARAMEGYEGERAALYARLKLTGLDEAPVQLAIFGDEATAAGHGLGRQTMPETLTHSVVCAIHTLWLAARAQGIGVGWLSILDAERLVHELDLPEQWRLVAYLCLGFPEAESVEPDLVRAGWQGPDLRARSPLRR